jgi:hypothetical protein
MKIRMADTTGFGFDEEFIDFRERDVEIFDGEGLIWLPEHSSTHVPTT